MSVRPASMAHIALQFRANCPFVRRALSCGVVIAMTSACAGVRRTPGPGTPVRQDSTAVAAMSAEQGATQALRPTIAVTPFRLTTADPTLAALGYALADLLATDLARSSQLQLVERSRLGEVLRELDLARTDRVDSASAPRVGRLLRARRLLLGALDTLGGRELRLSVRIADVETGVIHEALDARAPLNDILAAEKAVALRIFDALGVTLTPAERARVDARATLSLGALAAYGRGLEAELNGDARRATSEFRRAVGFDPAFRAAAERAQQLGSAAAAGANITPGLRSIDAPVAGVLDRLNRPLDLITTYARPIPGPGDPAFPGTLVTVIVVVRRP